MIIRILFGIVFLHAMQGYSQTTEQSVKNEARFISAKSAYLLGNYEEALSEFKSLLEEMPSNGTLHFDLAQTLYRMERKMEAHKHIEQAIQMDRDNEWYYETRGAWYRNENRIGEAINNYKMLAEISGESRHFYTWADLAESSGDIQGAIDAYQALRPHLKDPAPAIMHIHDLHMMKEDPAAAEEVLLNYLDENPDNVAILHTLASYYLFKEEEKKADEVITQIKALEPFHPGLKLLTADEETPSMAELTEDEAVLFVARKIDTWLNNDVGISAEELLNMVQEVEQHFGRSSKTEAMRGDIYFYNHQAGLASEAYRRSLKYQKNVPQVWQNYLTTLHVSQQYEKLTEESENALDFFPNLAIFQYMAALGHLQSGEPNEAQNYINRTLRITPDNSDLWYDAQILRFYIMIEDGVGEARQFLSSIEGLSPARHMAAAMALSDQGYSKEAMAYITEHNLPNNPLTVYISSKIAYKEGNLQEALKKSKEAVENDLYRNPELLHWHIQLLNETGDPDKEKYQNILDDILRTGQ